MSSKINQYILPIFIFLFFLLLYIHNLSRSVYGGDTGDLITTAKIMGVAHPPGYPLYTLLGFLLTRLNFFTPAFLVGLVSAFASVFSLIIFYFISLRFTKSKLISLVSTLVLGFNFIFWIYAEIAEVFSLNGFFVLALFFVALLIKENKNAKYFFVLAFLTGLSLTNHITIVLLFPSLLILVYEKLWNFLKVPKNIIISIVLFFAGFSIYLYVFIASSHNPPINWDNVKDVNSFLHLLLRKDYGTLKAGLFPTPIWSDRMASLTLYIKELITQLTLPVVVLIFMGSVFSFIKFRRIFFSILTGFLISGPLFIVYAGFPLVSNFLIGVNERFILMSLIIILLFLPFGIIAFTNIFNKFFGKRIYERLFILILLIIPLSLFSYNLPKTNLSKITVGNDLAFDYLTSLPKDSVLLIGGDTLLFNTWYVHYALGFRPDVTVMNFNTLSVEDYYNQQKKKYLKSNPKDSKDKNLDIKIFAYMAQHRPVYSSNELNSDKKYNGIKWMPYGLTKKLLFKNEEFPKKEELLKSNEKFWVNSRYYKNIIKEKDNLALGNLTISDISKIYSEALLYTANFIVTEYNDKLLAKEFIQRAIKISPDHTSPYKALGAYYLEIHNCKNAEDNFLKVNQIYPFDQNNYYLLYMTYSSCFKDEKKKSQLIKKYKEIFGKDPIGDFKKFKKK